MKTVELPVSVRNGRGTASARRLRKLDKVPGVIYGRGGENVLLEMDRRALEKTLKQHAHILSLTGESMAETVLLKDVQFDSMGDYPIHADFLRVSLDEAVTVTVQIELKGTPKGAKEGGVLDQVMREVEIECLPLSIPDSIQVDVSHLEVDGQLLVRDLKPPADIKVLAEPEAVVAVVHVPMEEAVVAPAEEGPAEPEVIAKEKLEEGEESESEESKKP